MLRWLFRSESHDVRKSDRTSQYARLRALLLDTIVTIYTPFTMDTCCGYNNILAGDEDMSPPFEARRALCCHR